MCSVGPDITRYKNRLNFVQNKERVHSHKLCQNEMPFLSTVFIKAIKANIIFESRDDEGVGLRNRGKLELTELLDVYDSDDYEHEYKLKII